MADWERNWRGGGVLFVALWIAVISGVLWVRSGAAEKAPKRAPVPSA